MEAFSLLNYWHTPGGPTPTLFAGAEPTFCARTKTTGYGEDGPYFDLEFTVSDATESGPGPEKSSKNDVKEEDEKDELFTVKLEVDELRGPLISLFARDNNDINSNNNNNKNNNSDSKEVMKNYLKMLKPLYVHVSGRYFEKMKFSGHVISFPGGGGGGDTPPCTAVGSNVKGVSNNIMKMGINGNMQAGLKVVRKHLGKSRSTPAVPGKSRRDESVLQVEDGIQAAIQHCKRSFNGFRDGESATLSRSVSDPSYEMSVMPPFSSAPTPLYLGEANEKNF